MAAIVWAVSSPKWSRVVWYVASTWDKRLHLLAPRWSTFWHTSIFNLSKLFLARRTCVCTFLNFSICLQRSGASSWDTSFMHSNVPRYSVRHCSMRFTVSQVSEMAPCRKVSTSWWKRHRGFLRANLDQRGRPQSWNREGQQSESLTTYRS